MRETKAGLAGFDVLLLHLVDARESCVNGTHSSGVLERKEHARGVRTDEAKREAAKHVESFGVGFWIRVRFPAPPPKTVSSRQ